MMNQRPALTTEQVEALYAFCARHYVHHYDLQTELVDHLATAIEEKMTANPALTFDAALAEVYDAFGINGFANVIRERTKQLERSNFKLRWRLFLQYFRWPKLAFTVLIGTLVFCLGKWLPQSIVGYMGIVAFLAMAALDIVYIRRIRRLSQQLQKKLLLTEDATSSGLWIFFCFQMLSSKLIWGSHDTLGDARLYALIVFVVLLTVAIMSNFEFCRALYGKAREQYPAAFKPAEAMA